MELEFMSLVTFYNHDDGYCFLFFWHTVQTGLVRSGQVICNIIDIMLTGYLAETNLHTYDNVFHRYTFREPTAAPRRANASALTRRALYHRTCFLTIIIIRLVTSRERPGRIPTRTFGISLLTRGFGHRSKYYLQILVGFSQDHNTSCTTTNESLGSIGGVRTDININP